MAKRKVKKADAPSGTLLIPKMSAQTRTAINRTKERQGINTNTKAAAYMMENFWSIVGALEESRRATRLAEDRLERLISSIEQKQDAEASIVNLLNECCHD